jgi:hypothetical protein
MMADKADKNDFALLATHQRVMRISHVLVDTVALAQEIDSSERQQALRESIEKLTNEDQGVLLHLAGAFGGLSAFEEDEPESEEETSDGDD